MQKNKVLNKKRVVLFFLIIMFLILLVFSTTKIIIWYKNTQRNEIINEETKEYIFIKNEAEEENYQIDFNKAREINNDIVAYLKVNNTDIDYFVVKTDNNSYYLTHNLNKEYNVAGWIFADYKNLFDGTDKNIVIYGHRMNDGSMFGSLGKVLGSEWATNPDNKIIELITEKGTIIYEVFSVYRIEKEDYYINTTFNNDTDYNEFLNVLKSRSYYNFNVDLSETTQILTLSTCAPGGKNRVVLHAKKIN